MAPAERPGDRDEHLARKYAMSRERAHVLHEQIAEVAAAEGIRFGAQPPQTLLAFLRDGWARRQA